MEIPYMEEMNEKKFLVWKINAFESGTSKSHNPKQDTCHWQSMSYETPLRFNLSLRESLFLESRCFRVMEKYDESGLMQILQEFGTFNILTVKGCSE